MEGSGIVKGWLEDGTEVELTPTQSQVVSGVLLWHNAGVPFTLPLMGRQAGKSVIMSTLAHHFSSTSTRSVNDSR
jgi:hypothetical protein